MRLLFFLDSSWALEVGKELRELGKTAEGQGQNEQRLGRERANAPLPEGKNLSTACRVSSAEAGTLGTPLCGFSYPSPLPSWEYSVF